MVVSDRLRCLSSATVEEQEESYVVELPKREIQRGDLQANDTYQVAILSSPSTNEAKTNTQSENDMSCSIEYGRLRRGSSRSPVICEYIS
jgi:hypothetical protein